MKNGKIFLTHIAIIAACCLLIEATAVMGQEPPPAPLVETAAVGPTAAEEPPVEEPTSLLQDLDLAGLIENPWHQWVILAVVVVLAWLAGRLVAATLQRIANRAERLGQPIRTRMFKDLVGPAKLGLLALGLTLGLAALTMSDPLRAFCASTLAFMYSIAVFWYAYNLVSVVEVVLRRLTAKTESSLDDQLVPLLRKLLRIVLVIVAAVFVVDTVFGRDVFALVAAIGVLGLPLGFAAKDSLGNVFGAITILFDRPFQVGDRVKYSGYDGVVEEIGFRSVRVRTLTGHMVTIPNSNIVNDPVENVAHRKSIRRVLNVTITYDTPREKIEQAVRMLRDILEEDGIREPIHATIDGNEVPPRVYFNEYNAESLNILMIYWYAPPAYWDYLDHAQRLNLRIFEEFEKAGIEFAFPTQTLYLAGDPKREMAVRMLGVGD